MAPLAPSSKVKSCFIHVLNGIFTIGIDAIRRALQATLVLDAYKEPNEYVLLVNPKVLLAATLASVIGSLETSLIIADAVGLFPKAVLALPEKKLMVAWVNTLVIASL